MKISREKTVGRLDRYLRLSGLGVLVFLLLLILLLVGNLIFYRLVKYPRQTAAASDATIHLLPLPASVSNWRLPETNLGDPLDDFLRVQLDFRAHEREYVAVKLSDRSGAERPPNLEAIRSFQLAATRPLRIKEMTSEHEEMLRAHDLRDASALILSESAYRQAWSRRPDIDDDEAAELIKQAEDLLRTYFTTGLYLATRRIHIDNIQVGLTMMRDAAQRLCEFYLERGDEAMAQAAGQLYDDLRPLSERIDMILGYQDDDKCLEIWIQMLEQSNSPAIRLEAAINLAESSRKWWRYGESAHALEALRLAVTQRENVPIRSYLFHLIESVEKNTDPPEGLQRDHSTRKSSGLKSTVDALFRRRRLSSR